MTSRARKTEPSRTPISTDAMPALGTPTPPGGPRRGPLAPVEIATAGTLAGLSLVLGLLTTLAPVLTTLLFTMTTVPLAMVSVRMRARTSITAVAAVVLAALMLGGVNSGITVAKAAVIGAVVGALLRRRTNEAGVVVTGLALGAATGALLDAVMWVLAAYRDLVIKTLRTSITGYMDLLGHWSQLRPITDWVKNTADVALDQWWIWVPLFTLVQVVISVVVAHWLLGVVLARLELGSDWDPLEAAVRATSSAADQTGESDAEPAGAQISPLPTTLTDVHFRYPGAQTDALDGVTLSIGEGEFVVVTGPNGSGKSTLALMLAGAQPSSGTIARPGGVGLGRVGGVALLAQRSELQPVGETVAEDVLWGLEPQDRASTDLEALLDRVGLAGKAGAATRNLSGGQLQRLALAGALARRPTLLVSDESTAMVDRAGRGDLVDILTSLTASGTTVVHITHDLSDATRATRILRMSQGRLVADSAGTAGVGHEVGEGDEATADTASGVPAPPSTNTGSPAPDRPRFGALLSDGAIPASSGATPHTGAPTEPLQVEPAERANAPSRAGIQPEPRFVESRSRDLPQWHRPSDLVAHHVAHAYDVGTPWEKHVLTDVSFTLAPGDGVLITGDNGSGKTTLSRILTGLMHPTWGTCSLGGEPMTNHVGQVALSMQFARLQLQRPSVRSDILAAAAAGTAIDVTSDPDRLVRTAMDEVGLPPELATRGIDQLSGGQMRRVALAGLLASEPRVLILDEPLAGLDTDSRELLLNALEARRRRGLAVLVISHDVDGLEVLCRRQMTLAEGVLS